MPLRLAPVPSPLTICARPSQTIFRNAARSRTGYFVGLSGLAFVTMSALGPCLLMPPRTLGTRAEHSFGHAGFTLSIVREPSRYLGQCSSSSAAYFSFVPFPTLKRCLCSLYTAIQTSSSDHSNASYTFFSQLLRIGTIFVPIVALESQRQTKFWARRGIDLFMLMAQALSGAVSIPLYFATVSHYEDAGGTAGRRVVTRPEHAWTALISTLVGYCLPLLYGVQTDWSNNAISLFLGFPLYIILLNRVLPPLVRRSQLLASGVRPSLPISMAATLAGVLSADANFKLLLSGIPFKQVFWPYIAPPSTTRDLHILLVHDYLFVSIALDSYVLCQGPSRRTLLARGKEAAGILAQAAVFGPTAAIAWMWAKVELDREMEDIARESAGERQRLLSDDRTGSRRE